MYYRWLELRQTVVLGRLIGWFSRTFPPGFRTLCRIHHAHTRMDSARNSPHEAVGARAGYEPKLVIDADTCSLVLNVRRSFRQFLREVSSAWVV